MSYLSLRDSYQILQADKIEDITDEEHFEYQKVLKVDLEQSEFEDGE